MRLLGYLNIPVSSWLELPFSWRKAEVSHTSRTVTTISTVAVPPVNIDMDRNREDFEDLPPTYPGSDASENLADGAQTPLTSDDKCESDVPEESKEDDEDEVTYSTSWTNYNSHTIPHHHTHLNPIGPEFHAMMNNISLDVEMANAMAQRHMERSRRQMEEKMSAEATRAWGNGKASSSRTGSNAQGFVENYGNIYISGSGTSTKKARMTERRGRHTVNIVGCNNVVNTSISNVGNVSHTNTVIVNGKVVGMSF